MTIGNRLDDWKDRGVNWAFLSWVLAVLVPVLTLWAVGVDPRVISTLLGALAGGWLLYRLITTWRDTSVLVHAVTGLLIITVILGAVGQYQLLQHGGVPQTVVLWPIVLHRAACIVLCIKWVKWIDRKYSPFLQTPPIPR